MLIHSNESKFKRKRGRAIIYRVKLCFHGYHLFQISRKKECFFSDGSFFRIFAANLNRMKIVFKIVLAFLGIMFAAFLIGLIAGYFIS